MTWGDLGETVALVAVLLAVAALGSAAAQHVLTRRIAATPCQRCGVPFGRVAARAAVDYYERVHGPGIKVCGGRPRYRAAQVVCCPACQAESVFDGWGSFVEPFAPKPITRNAEAAPDGQDRYVFTVIFLAGVTALVVMAVIGGPLWLWFVLAPLTALWGWAAWMNWWYWRKSRAGSP
jgi:hypothetical protein